MSGAPVRAPPILAATVSLRGRELSAPGAGWGGGSFARSPAQVCDAGIPEGDCAFTSVALPARLAARHHIADQRNPPDLDIPRTSPRKNEIDVVQHPCPMPSLQEGGMTALSRRGFCTCSARPVRSSDNFACRVKFMTANL